MELNSCKMMSAKRNRAPPRLLESSYVVEERGYRPTQPPQKVGNVHATEPIGKEVENRKKGRHSKHGRNNRYRWEDRNASCSYLIAVHFVFPDDLDGNLAHLVEAILSTVDIAERAVTHLLLQNPPF